ncbi:ABC transporter ATP-binding protein [uncultured Desulfuromonas sp.]|uniref:ABC transporter ATP-binding protein n=1 Tax=uncultured Desulfuromonas sp. TaxID=181013 RepID=UPI002AAB9C0D|nr:ABC transporter ATP-binding protein [uncultured Desulfuromonas sp.]
MAATGEVIRLQSARRSYDVGDSVVHALNGIDWSVMSGSSWAILGASGSGKSTLLNILGCLDRLTEGNYLLLGQNIQHLDDDQLSDLRLKNFGFIFQSFNLINQLTVVENVEMPLYYAGVEPALARRRARELTARVGLDARETHRPAQLSGGQQQRVAIARALANDPPVLLADEPTGNLDSTTGGQILELLHELSDQGKTLITVTHDHEIARQMDEQLYLSDGRVVSAEGGDD